MKKTIFIILTITLVFTASTILAQNPFCNPKKTNEVYPQKACKKADLILIDFERIRFCDFNKAMTTWGQREGGPLYVWCIYSGWVPGKDEKVKLPDLNELMGLTPPKK